MIAETDIYEKLATVAYYGLIGYGIFVALVLAGAAFLFLCAWVATRKKW